MLFLDDDLCEGKGQGFGTQSRLTSDTREKIGLDSINNCSGLKVNRGNRAAHHSCVVVIHGMDLWRLASG